MSTLPHLKKRPHKYHYYLTRLEHVYTALQNLHIGTFGRYGVGINIPANPKHLTTLSVYHKQGVSTWELEVNGGFVLTSRKSLLTLKEQQAEWEQFNQPDTNEES